MPPADDEAVVARRRSKQEAFHRAPHYTLDERRLVRYLMDATNGIAGAGVNPVGLLIASHAYAMHQLKESRKKAK